MVSSSEYVIWIKCVDETDRNREKKNQQKKTKWLQKNENSCANMDDTWMSRVRARFPVLNHTMRMLSFKRAQHMRNKHKWNVSCLQFLICAHQPPEIQINCEHDRYLYLSQTCILPSKSGFVFSTPRWWSHVFQLPEWDFLSHKFFWRSIRNNEREHVIRRTTSDVLLRHVQNLCLETGIPHLPWTIFLFQPTPEDVRLLPNPLQKLSQLFLWNDSLHSLLLSLRRVKCHIFV